MRMTLKELEAACGGKLLFGAEETEIRNISFDSRSMKGRDLFVPVIGARTDGHDYMPGAFINGAIAALSSRSYTEEGREALAAQLRAICPEAGLISVDNTVEALQRIGRWYRKHKIFIPCIGITGSVGKTTTRAMTAAAVSAEKKVYSTKGNANSQLGVPVTVTETDPDAEAAVFELGMSEPGEMHRISETACCDTAIITNIGVSHIANFGSSEGIMKEKLHILDGMPSGCRLFLNGDDPLLARQTEASIHAMGIAEGKTLKIVYYGTAKNAGCRAENISLDGSGFPSFDAVVPLDGREERVRLKLSVRGGHMILNALAALAAAADIGVSPAAAAKALEAFTGLSGRGERVTAGGVTLLDDSYNAAPASMKAGLSVLKQTPCSGRRIAVLADMLELGDEEAAMHLELGHWISEQMDGLHAVYLYGENSRLIGQGMEEGHSSAETKYFSSHEALTEALKEDIREGDAVLFKGSHSMGLSKVLEEVRRNLQS